MGLGSGVAGNVGMQRCSIWSSWASSSMAAAAELIHPSFSSAPIGFQCHQVGSASGELGEPAAMASLVASRPAPACSWPLPPIDSLIQGARAGATAYLASRGGGCSDRLRRLRQRRRLPRHVACLLPLGSVRRESLRKGKRGPLPRINGSSIVSRLTL
ncbi:unnamed protein product [Urochloa humidicola]